MKKRICLAVGIGLSAALGTACRAGEEHRGDATASSRQPAETASVATPWYHRTVARDLNGDSRLDSAILAAVGPRSDSLAVSLTLFVDGQEAYKEEWDSSYELVDVADSLRVPPRRDDYIRERLDAALARIRTGPLDTASARLLGDGQSALDTIMPRPTVQLTLSYGYESTVALVWHAPTRRFAVLWTCC